MRTGGGPLSSVHQEGRAAPVLSEVSDSLLVSSKVVSACTVAGAVITHSMSGVCGCVCVEGGVAGMSLPTVVSCPCSVKTFLKNKKE